MIINFRHFIKLSAFILAFILPMATETYGQYTLDTNILNACVGVHPRLFLNAATISTLRASLQTASYPYSTTPPYNNPFIYNNAGVSSSPYWAVWSEIKNQADYISTTVPYPNNYNPADSEQLWQRTVGANIANLAMAYEMTKTAVPTDSYWIEAEEAGILSSAMVTGTSALASGSAYITTSNAAVANPGNTILPAEATYLFNAAGSRTYYIWARCYASSTNANAYWVNIDGGANISAGPSIAGSWVWNYVTSVDLSAGDHSLQITHQKLGCQIDKFFITSDSSYSQLGGSIPSLTGSEQHWFEAENCTLDVGSPYLVANGSDSQAVGGLLVAASSTPSNTVTNSTSQIHQAVILNGGSYDVWIRTLAHDATTASIWYAVDNGPYSKITTSVYWNWTWTKVTSGAALSAGSHTIHFSNCQTGLELDRFAILPAGSNAPIDPNPYFVSALTWAQAACAYSPWSGGTQDLSAGHLLMALSEFYDWCYSDLGTSDRQLLLSTLSTKAAALYAGAPSMYWNTTYLQNHGMVNLTGLAVASAAIYGDTGAPTNTTIQTWINQTLGFMNNTMKDLGSDGASHEGVGYWEYGVGSLLKYMDIANKFFGANMYATPWFQKSIYYRLYFSLPQNSLTAAAQTASPNMGDHIDFGDDTRFSWYGPNYLLRALAMHGTDSNAAGLGQWLANQMDMNGLNNDYNADPWLNLLWWNTSITATPPTSQPTFYHFTDLDFAISRTGWDGNESVLGFQCGPPMGHSVQLSNTATSPSYTDWGLGHVHPVANNFCLFGAGDWLISNDGYSGLKVTGYDNTLLVSNPSATLSGQIGEGGSWFSPASAAELVAENPSIDKTKSFTTPFLDYLVGDAASAYSSGAQLTKYRRHLLFLKSCNVLVVVDDVALTAPHALELRFFPEQNSVTQISPTSYSIPGINANLLFQELTPSVSTLSTKSILFSGNSASSTAFSVSPPSNVSDWSNAVAFSWSGIASSPNAVTMVTTPNTWQFSVAGQNQIAILDRVSSAENARVVSTVEMESVTPSAPMSIVTGSGAGPLAGSASGLGYIIATTGNNNTNPTSWNAQYSLSVPTSGTYTVYVRYNAPAGTSASSPANFFYSMNPSGPPTLGHSTCSITSPTIPASGFTWLTLGTFNLNAGSNTLAIAYGTLNLGLDEFIYTNDSNFSTISEFVSSPGSPPPPGINSALTATVGIGQPFSYQITASNSPTSYGATGLPSGLNVNTSTGIISGILSTPGTYTSTITATGAGGMGSATFMIVVQPYTPVITSATSLSGTAGVPFSFQVTATNSPTSFSLQGGGSTPFPGLSLNLSTGLISGTPTISGSLPATIFATNGGGTGPGKGLTITISALSKPVISSTLSATGTIGVLFNYQITASNNPTSFTATGLPPGTNFNTTTGIISGVPTAAGTTSTTIKATNAAGTSTSKTLTTTIVAPPPPSITSANTATGTLGVSFNYQITGSNTPTSFSATGLPSGLSLSATTGLISGAPLSTGTVAATIRAINVGGTGSATLTITVLPAPPTIPSGLSGVAGNGLVTLNWNSSVGASSYSIARSLISGSNYSFIANNILPTTYADTTVTNGVTYYYEVCAVNAGGASGNSAPISAYPAVPITMAECSTQINAQGGGYALTISSSIISHTYQLQGTTSLNPSAWVNLGSPQNGTGGVLILQDPFSRVGLPQYFYRVLIQN